MTEGKTPSTKPKKSLMSHVLKLSVAVLVIGALASIIAGPTIRKDRSCHNMFRDGRTHISPEALAYLQVPYEHWPAIKRFFADFAGKNNFSYRAKRDFYLSVCTDIGVNITMFQNYAPATGGMEQSRRHEVIVGVYEVRDGAAWQPIARDLLAEIDARWPGDLDISYGMGQVMSKPDDLAPD